MDMINTYVPPYEVIRKFGYLIKGEQVVSGLRFALAIIKSDVGNVKYRKNCASTAASDIFKLKVSEKCYFVVERIK
mgnify:CR=1 FL=1